MRGNHLSDIDYIVVEETDGIEGDDSEARLPIINNHHPRPEIVMNAVGGTAVVKTGNPDRIEH
ncbi:MAG TPA: hypothetical protein EYO30_07925, partial [Gemmatimonadetes bacterium]|nr:hypothetical protein [Gemmatimonadota bacterium]